MLIKNKPDEFSPIVQECCICRGQTTLWITGTATIQANGQEYKVYYHKTCFSERTKPQVLEALNKLAGITK